MGRKGFTLVEMLVVIAVITVLAAIMLPALLKSKKQAGDVLCTSNLRQLGSALQIYLQENPTYPQGFCGAPNCHPSIPYDEYKKLGTWSNDWQNSSWWFHLLKGSIGDDFSKGGVLWCPLRHLTDAEFSENILCGNYGINYAICKTTITSTNEFYGTPVRSERVSGPSSKLLLMDSGYALISWKALAPDTGIYSFENPDRQDAYFLPGAAINENHLEAGSVNAVQQDDAVKGRHSSGRFNAAFADGHVDRKKPSSVEPSFDATGTLTSSSGWSP
jgi:prepilin-type N-terminal cleavage/methylation domain-containing protein/prepilin-type processing-associated H-X9-DG protein